MWSETALHRRGYTPSGVTPEVAMLSGYFFTPSDLNRLLAEVGKREKGKGKRERYDRMHPFHLSPHLVEIFE
jgi:hypothetical protein